MDAFYANDGRLRSVPQGSRASNPPRTGVSQPVLNRFVHGERGISLETAAKLCVHLKLQLRPGGVYSNAVAKSQRRQTWIALPKHADRKTAAASIASRMGAVAVLGAFGVR